MILRDISDGPVVKTTFPMQGVQVQSLVGELITHMLHGKAVNK